jgi:hypothetical protein
MTNAYAARQRGLQALAAAQKETQIRELYQQDFTDEQIAERLSVDRSRVTQLRNQMGLPPRWGRKNGCTFTIQNDADLRSLKENTSSSWELIAFLLNKPQEVVYARYQLLLTMMLRTADGKRCEQVRCMICKDPFMTPNRRQIHMCDVCRKRVDGLGGSLDDGYQDVACLRASG